MSLVYNATFDKNTRKLSFEDKAGNEIYSFTVPERAPTVDDITKPLTFRATQDASSVRLIWKQGNPGGDFQTSRDGGNTWADYTLGTAITLNTGDEVAFRAKSNRTSSGQTVQNYFYFTMKGKIEAWHNAMSLYRTSDFATYNTVVEYAFSHLFNGCTSLVKAPVLPSTTLSKGCYWGMFYGCTSLTEAPELPATTPASNCYSEMFYGCTSLTKAPALPATTLSNACYSEMFYGCTSLVNAPELPETTLAPYCYSNMFRGCTSLTKAPALPATTLAERCYWKMFYGCTSLTEAPALPATTLADYCYSEMFYGCTSLTKAPALPATTLAEYCYQFMFNGCTSLTEAPELTATTLTRSCYSNMFNGCTSLTKAPALPATTLAEYCYQYMFNGCTSLTKAPALPATTLAEYCYQHMFEGCTSLTKAPALPATTLANNCYQYMFKGCTSLTEAPELPATTLVSVCYNNMFYGCTSLTKAPELPATTLASNCYSYMFYGCSRLNEVRCQIPSSYSSSQISSYASYWLNGVASTGTFYTNADANWPSGASGIPTGWTRVNERAKDDIAKPLTFKATQDGSTVKLTKNGSPTGVFQTSNDGGNTWADYTIGTVITLNTGDEVSFRAKSDRTSAQSDQSYFYFMMEGKIDAWHNVMSLYRTNDFSTYNTVVNYAFYSLFKDCTSLTKAPVLPATTLADYCYSNMFHGCTSLTKAPVLPATDFMIDFSLDGSYCYRSMFSGCTSLTEAPELPATRLNIFCYSGMFEGCTSLTKAPELPATSLEESCYKSMFSGCTSLTEAPELPATSLAFECYSGMFNGCTSLANAPALPATTLKSGCYNWMFARCIELKKSPELTATKLANRCYNAMFYGCGSLNEVRCQIPSTISAEDIPKYTTNGSEISPEQWLYNVSPTGTFYTNADANWPSDSPSGIPTGWTRIPKPAPIVSDIRKPLTFRSTQDGSTVSLKKNGSPDGAFQTSRDGGNTWTDYTLGTYITLNTGREVSFRAKADRTSEQTVQNYFSFQMTGKIEAWHNVMSLYRTSDFATYSKMVSHAFYKLFLNCTSLTKAPKLPVTTLAHSCYQYMFDGCTSLTKAPALPSTTLAVQCYYSMFDGCTSLTEAPALPATTLAGSCYQYMFYGCTSLTKTPALSATTLADHCYQEMFRNCSNLNEVRCKMSSSYSSNAISTYAPYWLSGVSSKGTFYTNADANWPSGDDGIPQTWTRANIDDYPTT